MWQRYSIARNADGEWVVRAEGRDLLLCARKSDALKAAKDANALSDNMATTTASNGRTQSENPATITPTVPEND